MQVKENFSLSGLNTFGIHAHANYFAEAVSEEEVVDVLSSPPYNTLPLLVLGGGSNILFAKDFDGLVLQVNTKGIFVTEEDEMHVSVKAAAGEEWDGLVRFCVAKGFGGLENLSLIPGCVGAAPIQNIGAYGAEMKDAFFSLEALHISTMTKKIFTREECRFGYRDSIFKHEAKGQYIILSVTFRLGKQPVVDTSFGVIKKELEAQHILNPGIHEVREAICAIRRSKLPDPKEIGNAGSFFKNPYVTAKHFQQLKSRYHGMPAYLMENGCYKLAAAWLIEQCGFKGMRRGDAGVHSKQALVLVNYGNATGNDLIALANDIRQSVKKRFEVEIEMEVNVV